MQTFGIIALCALILGLLYTAYAVLTAPVCDEKGHPIGPGLEPVDFPERTQLIAKDQQQYKTLPAHQKLNEEGEIVTCWRLSIKDRITILLTGRLWCSIWTFYHPLQPVLFSVRKRDVLPSTASQNENV